MLVHPRGQIGCDQDLFLVCWVSWPWVDFSSFIFPVFVLGVVASFFSCTFRKTKTTSDVVTKAVFSVKRCGDYN